MTINLTGRTAVITGGSRGLGEAMAKALAEAGATIALVARDTERLKQVRDAIAQRGGTAEIFTADVTQENDVAAVADAVQQNSATRRSSSTAPASTSARTWWISRSMNFAA